MFFTFVQGSLKWNARKNTKKTALSHTRQKSGNLAAHMSKNVQNVQKWRNITDFTMILSKWGWDSFKSLEMIQTASVLLFQLCVQESSTKNIFSRACCYASVPWLYTNANSFHFLDALSFKDFFCTLFLVAAADFSSSSILLHKFSTWRDQWYCQFRRAWEDPGGCWLSEPLPGQGEVLEIRREPLIWMTSCPCNSKLMAKRKGMEALGDGSKMSRVTSLNHKQKTMHHKQLEYPGVY